jgi:hypothetical protein
MHLLIPYAAPLSDDARRVLATLKLPALQALLDELTPAARDDGDAQSLSPPHERVLARACGLEGADGCFPWGAREAERAGLDPAGRAWGVLTPVHWRVDADGVRLEDPHQLALDANASQALFDTVRPLLEEEGAVAAWRAPLSWLIAHPALDGLATASPDRAVGRPVEPWLPHIGFVRRLQLAVQMLLHRHAVNDAREAAGQWPVNSVWLSGCGRHQPAPAASPELNVDERLRGPALAGDWAAWADAWRALDAGPLDALRGTGGTLTLCGERSAQRFQPSPPGWWPRLSRRFGFRRTPHPTTVLETL